MSRPTFLGVEIKIFPRSATSGLPTPPDAGRKSEQTQWKSLHPVIQVQEDTSHENAMVWRKNENEAWSIPPIHSQRNGLRILVV
jgi:hypothetical protein